MNRNPDINLNLEEIPSDCYLHRGKKLQLTAKAAKIPFGLAYTKTVGKQHSQTTHGLIIKIADRERMLDAITKKEAALSRRASGST